MRTTFLLALATLLGTSAPAQGRTPPKPPPPQHSGVEKVDDGQEKSKVGGVESKTGVQKPGETGDPKKGEPKKDDPKRDDPKRDDRKQDDPKKEPVLTGTDPADIKAKQSAADMLKAEKRLAELLKAGKIKGIDQVLSFEEISSWPYVDGLKGMPKKLNKLEGKTVMMTGFMLPIDEVENIREFLLVQSLWSCCYGQPPDINGTVRVIMQGKTRIDYKFEPIKVVGKFRIKPTIEDGFCVDVYQLETTDVQVIK